MYREIITALTQAGQDDSVVTLVTGEGEYFCSGNDLNNFLNIPPEGPEKLAADGRELLRLGSQVLHKPTVFLLLLLCDIAHEGIFPIEKTLESAIQLLLRIFASLLRC